MAHAVIRDYLRAAVGSDPAGAADADLLSRFARSRDESAFELLVWRHAGLVQRVCRAVLRDEHLAEDAAQAAFLVLARKAHTFTGRGSVVGWLYRVARRMSVRLARKRARLPAASDRLDLLPAAEPSAGPGADEAVLLCAEIDRLPERYRVPVLLCFFEGLTHAEAARRTGWPLGTVAGRLARAKELLARRLSRRGLGLAAVALGVPSGAFVGGTARAAVAFASGGAVVPAVHPSVVHLAEGAVRAMTTSVLKLSAAAAAVVCAVTAGVWAGAAGGRTHPGSPGSPEAPAAAQAAAQPNPQPAAKPEREADAKQRERSATNLKQILIAIHNYHDVHGHFPRNIAGGDGKALLSWRVAILPYLDQEDLHKQFKLDEPWNSEHNKTLLDKMPDAFRIGVEPKGATTTYYQGFAGPGTLFEPNQKLTFGHVPDGTANTLAVVEAGPPVEWTKPADIPYDPEKEKPLPKLETPFPNVLMAATADGAVYPLPANLNATVLRWLVERADGQVLVPGLNELRVRFRPLNAEDQKLAAALLKKNAELTKQVADLLAEQQKLIEETARKRNPADPTKELDIDLLQGRQHVLQELVDRLKPANEEMRRPQPPPATPQKK
jgi:RNA polymerase sigma factor (sigma-70 family)